MLGVRSRLLCGTRHDQWLLNLTHTHTIPSLPFSARKFPSVPLCAPDGDGGRLGVEEGSQIQMAAKHSLGQPAMLIVNLKPLASSHSH